MRPLPKLLNIAVLMFVIVLQACGMPSAETRTEVATPTAEPAAALPGPANNVPLSLAPTVIPQMPGAAVRPERWAAETLLERASGGLIAYNMADGQTLFHLPRGRLSADGKHYVTAELLDNNDKGGTTQVGLYDVAANFRLTTLFNQNGSWALGAVSSNGRWAALTRTPAELEKAAWTKAKRWQTDVQIFDTLKRAVVHSIKLDGNFEVDALSTEGSSLFLIEHVPAINPEHYRVRLYSVLNGKLQEGALVDKTAPPDEVMTGYAWDAVASPSGHWLLTLYLDTRRNSAFVHALDLDDQFAICIDLPSGSGDFNVLKQYTLTLSPDGNKLYAANSALGVVAHINLYQSIELVRTERFSPQGFATPPSEDVRAPAARSIISRDGSKLYFSGGWDVWGYDTKAGKFDGPILSSAPIAELGLSADGARLYLAREQLPLSVIDTATGGELHFPTLTGP